MKRLLLLEDGSVFEGEAFGVDVETSGEIVFSTGMTGYQESITDNRIHIQFLIPKPMPCFKRDDTIN
ncbi:hypothetical protein SAG0176_08000 [Streptococcus agalactiae LDS 623]|nr:carbamoyl-phosphate synthase domain-containing protein [Streptococcus agalactiae]EPU42791.1 hypothetical protein SAG0181_04660 [Streptococcus agalactiae LDS 628]EPX16243.1 hypothetical protein SAG0176_08000 [Streptococcus agalactiae LDS 623]